MSRSPRTPSYRLHRPSGRAVVTLNGQDVYLGKHDSPESRAEYDRLIAEWLVGGRRLPTRPAVHQAGTTGFTVNELLLAYFLHVEAHYRRADGTPTSEVREYRQTLRIVKQLYGHTPAAAFGPLAFKAVRQKMVEGGLSRGVVNQRAGRVRRMFKWAVAEELVPASVLHGLQAVGGLQRGRTPAPDAEPIAPVARAVVEETLPHLNRHVAGMVRVQLLTGMRSGEVCLLRACDLDVQGPVWIYRPRHHKTAHHGHRRSIAIGPRAQEILRPFLTADTQAYLFRPAAAEAERQAARRAARKSKVQPSQVCRKSKRRGKGPGEHYTSSSYHQAIRKTVLTINTSQACAACKPLKPTERCAACRAAALPPWHPHQLRHTHATEVRRRFGLEAAQVALGHSSADVTQVYAERDLTLAAQVAAQIG